ncbi:PIN domain-containing protein [Treponema denticola]|jgi:PIN domain protein|uniref:PIN domain-containing protein n=1 Tax=Treponema denticola TaxID=158 RepID=A0A9Q9BPH8_TREDN|nr:PIN domain-containing protein [Treponema denticola]UTC89974.1 PIN domain-containing protein [Treponema denticola]UTD00673.1 PIN domain-containing protein [Treponema denticola]
MKKVLIDLNIILDFLNKRNFHEEAANIINMCVEKKLYGFIAAHEITTLSYFLLKEKKDKNKAADIISALLDMFNIIPIDEKILREALFSPVKDYEDAVIEVSSVKNSIDYIISRNLGDFKSARVQVFTPEQFFIKESNS